MTHGVSFHWEHFLTRGRGDKRPWDVFQRFDLVSPITGHELYEVSLVDTLQQRVVAISVSTGHSIPIVDTINWRRLQGAQLSVRITDEDAE